MSIIHMDTDEVLYILTSVENRSMEAADQVDTLRKAFKSLAQSWTTTRTNNFTKNASNLVDNLNNKVEELEFLCSRVRDEVKEWENVDFAGSKGFRQFSITMYMDPSDLHLNEPPAPLPLLSEDDFNWLEFAENFWDFPVVDIIPIFPILSTFFGILNDVYSGEELDHAFTSEVAQTLIDDVLLTFAEPLLGPVGGLTEGYEDGLWAGNLIAGILELSGQHEKAVEIQQMLMTVDVREEMGNAVADMLLSLGSPEATNRITMSISI
jgi:hypothetical protein